jgi:hypothetical protein
MVDMTEYLRSWISITPGRQQAPISGVFINSRFVDEAVNLLQKDPDYMDYMDHDQSGL